MTACPLHSVDSLVGVTSPNSGASRSPWELVEYKELDAKAKKYQRLSRWALTLELTLSVAAGFTALGGTRGSALIALSLLVTGLIVGVLASRLNWAMKWHESRSEAELTVSAYWRRSIDALPPDDADQIRLRGEHYLNGRILDQQAYYTRRTAEFISYSRLSRLAIWLLYAVSALVAALQVFGTIDIDLVGPTIALVASVRVWSESREWERTAGIYAYCASFLDQESIQTITLIDRDALSTRELTTVVRRVEDQLSSESERWLALNNFDLFDKRKYANRADAATTVAVLDVQEAWNRVKFGKLYLPIEQPIPARQLTEPFHWSSAKGDALIGQPGDWLVEDGAQKWTVADAVFRETYEQVDNGTYAKRAPVFARMVSGNVTLVTLEGNIALSPGDWLVCNLNGDCWGMTAVQFASKYRPALPSGS